MAPKKGSHTSPRTEFKKDLIPWNKGRPMAPEAKVKMIAKKKGLPAWNKGIPLNEWMPGESNEVRKAKISQNNARHWLGQTKIAQRIKAFTKATKRPSAQLSLKGGI